jgi:hypothetical protein
MKKYAKMIVGGNAQERLGIRKSWLRDVEDFVKGIKGSRPKRKRT